ncbi:MAG: hypothetical protein WCY82_01865 [Desulfotomaculaceae bacterium]
MHWMPWVRGKQISISTTVPLRWARAGKRKLTGWLIDKNGCLEAIYAVISSRCVALVGGPVGKTWPGATTFAGGLRPCGAARLTGVLHYFTRGPDGIF